MTELQRNSLSHLEGTLADLGSDEHQRRYKQNVPFVHVPLELAAQCEQHALQLERDWFRELFTADDIEALRSLFAAIAGYRKGEDWRDVDGGILSDPDWRAIMGTALQLHERLVRSGRLVPLNRG